MLAKEAIDRCMSAMQEYRTSGLSIREISKKYNIPRPFLSGFMLASGIDIYSRKSHVNNLLFEHIDSEEKAYWLGFLYADGSVCKFAKSYKIELTLKESDIEHLIKFKNFLGLPKNPAYRTAQKAYRVTFGSRKMAEDLIKLGCTQKKSLTLKFPTKVPEELLKHFIRGYFDGDGCLTIRHSKQAEVADVSVLGTFEFLVSLCKHLNLENKPVKKDSRSTTNVYCVRFNKKEGYVFLHYIYDDASIYLQRKYDKYKICRAFEQLEVL